MNALEALAHKVVQAGTRLRYAHKIIAQMREIIRENGGPVKLGFSIHNDVEERYCRCKYELENLFANRHNLQFVAGDEQQNFIKRIRRIEIKNEIEELRTYRKEVEEISVVAGQSGYTLDTYDYALASEYVAIENKVAKMFKARNKCVKVSVL